MTIFLVNALKNRQIRAKNEYGVLSLAMAHANRPVKIKGQSKAKCGTDCHQTLPGIRARLYQPVNQDIV